MKLESENALRKLLHSIDHKGYPSYKSLAGGWQFDKYDLYIDHVQGDPFAGPSSLHVELNHQSAGFPLELYEEKCARIALQDYLTRAFSAQIEQYNFKAKGSGKSGLISISRCGQEVLERSACEITGKKLIVRFKVGFPAFGRTINAPELEKIIFEFLPRCIEGSLLYEKADKKKAAAAIQLAKDQKALRDILRREGLVSFVADGAVLLRKSGISDLPMRDSVLFSSPKSLQRTFTLPYHGAITGMAVPKGITLIVGGGYHGKSTLLGAIQAGVYNHVGGDGREYVITDDTAIKLRAEEGRFIRDVDISLFINDLPNNKDTKCFTTEDASGSTSQAAGVIEGIEAGAGLFLIDEDTSATNFMVRDEFMQEVISQDKEPITPFIARARQLYEQAGISTIIVAGSSGEFFHIADYVLQMDCYRTLDITKKVKALCQSRRTPDIHVPDFALPEFKRIHKAYKSSGKNNRNNARYEHMKVKAYGKESFSLDKENVDVRYIEQLADSEQTDALAYLVRYYLEQLADGQRTIKDCAARIDRLLDEKGFGEFCGAYVPCGLAKPRIQEIFACINRLRI